MNRIAPVIVLLLCGSGLPGCAGKQSWDEISSEVYVHTLPDGARVSVDGKEAGRAPVAASVPPGGAVAGGVETPASFSAELPGFVTTTVPLDRRNLPQEIVLVLAPQIAGEPPRAAPAWTDAAGMQATGVRLVAAARCEDALVYFHRALELEPRLPDALREGGRCNARLGKRGPASQMLGSYLMNHPDAPDADRVRSELEAIDRKRTIDLQGIP
jgi:hypothetical protein